MSTKLRLSPSGPFARAADVASNPSLGDYLTPTSDGELSWKSLPVPALVMRQLTSVRVLDVGTSTPLASQNGTFESPYATMAQCVSDLTLGGLVLVVPGDYSLQSWDLTHTAGTLTIVNLAGLWADRGGSPDQAVVAPAITTQRPAVLRGVAISGTVTGSDIGTVFWLRNCSCDEAIACYGLYAEETVFSYSVEITVHSPAMFDSCVFNITPGNVFLHTPSDTVFQDCRWIASCGIDVTGGGGLMTFDQASFNSFAETQCVNSGGYKVLGAPLSGTVEIAANPALPAGRTLLASIAITGSYYQPSVVCNFCGAVPPSGVVLDAKLGVGHIEIYGSNYTGAAVNFPKTDVRWKLLAP